MLAFALVGCLEQTVSQGDVSTDAIGDLSETGLTAHLPSYEGPHAPTLVRSVPGDAQDVDRLNDVGACADCHTDVVHQWRSSAHANSSFNNPWYRAVIDAFRREVGSEESRFCGGCHDPLLVLSGGMDREIEPDEPLAYAGVTCLVCHGIRQARSDGNGSFTLTTSPVPYPRENDPASVEEHRRRVAVDLLRTPQLCRTCHRGVLGPHMGNPVVLSGIADPDAWSGSSYAGSRAEVLDVQVAAAECRTCHMPDGPALRADGAAKDGLIHSHRFAGAHTAMAAFEGDNEQLQATERRLVGAATIDVAAVVRADGSSVAPADRAVITAGESIDLDVVIRNTQTGHRFPGGVRDTQDTWIELRLVDAQGRMIAEAGARQAHSEDPTAFVLRTTVLDEQGHPDLRHLVQRFRGLGYDHTIAPRDAAVVRYTVTLPSDIALPLRVEARLRHRRHMRSMHAFACESTQTSRGRAFTRNARGMGRARLDGCAVQPITEIARAVIWLGVGSDVRPNEGDATRPEWQRLFDHALGLSHGLSERLDEARPSLDRMLGIARSIGPQEQAMAMSLLARIDGRQGRLLEALAWADRAEALIGSHPALDRARGHAYAAVWRWQEASNAYRAVTDVSPRDTAAWRDLARALGSSRRDRGALLAAQRGLELNPRDEGLLRTQSLALERLGSPSAMDATDAYLLHRSPDDAPALRLRCSDEVANCDRDRQPIPEYEMRLARP